MASRYCAACGRNLAKLCYSKNQWLKGNGVSRCTACVHGGGGAGNNHNVDPTQTARRNNATQATFDQHALDHPFAQGAFRWVAKGKCVEGSRRGEACVCKWFKTGGVMEEHFYDSDLDASNEAIRLITQWNSQNLITKMVKVNLPEVWTFLPPVPGGPGGKCCKNPSYKTIKSSTPTLDGQTKVFLGQGSCKLCRIFHTTCPMGSRSCATYRAEFTAMASY